MIQEQDHGVRRLFFALWPNATSRRELVSLQKSLALGGAKPQKQTSTSPLPLSVTPTPPTATVCGRPLPA